MVVSGKKFWKCIKCSYELGLVTDDYKDHALKYEAPLSKVNASYIPAKSKKYVLREYYCPKCATMFEVDMVAKEAKQIRLIQLSEGII